MTEKLHAVVDVGFATWAPAAAPRGRFLVLPGRGDEVTHYRRLGARLSADGYTVLVPEEAIVSVDDARRAVTSLGPGEGITIVVGVDTSAGFLASVVATAGPDEHRPDALVLAGSVTKGGHRPAGAAADADAEIALRTTCPLHSEILRTSGAPTIASSAIVAEWPSAPVEVPTLIVHGSRDAIAPLDGVLEATSAWPHRELVGIRGGVHDVLNDRHHRTVAAELVSFAERLRETATAEPLVDRGLGGQRGDRS